MATSIKRYNVRAQQPIEAVQIKDWTYYYPGHDDFEDDRLEWEPPTEIMRWLNWHLRQSDQGGFDVAVYVENTSEWIYGNRGDFICKDVNGYVVIIKKADFEKVYQEIVAPTPVVSKLELVKDDDLPQAIRDALGNGTWL